MESNLLKFLKKELSKLFIFSEYLGERIVILDDEKKVIGGKYLGCVAYTRNELDILIFKRKEYNDIEKYNNLLQSINQVKKIFNNENNFSKLIS